MINVEPVPAITAWKHESGLILRLLLSFLDVTLIELWHPSQNMGKNATLITGGRCFSRNGKTMYN